MIDLSGTQPAWPEKMLSLWGRCAEEAVNIHELWRVPAPQGDEILREELGRLLALEPEFLTITASVRAAALTYARLADHVVVECPSYTGSIEVLRSGGAAVELRPWEEISADSIPEDAMVWLTSPARNPDGRSLTPTECDLQGALLRTGRRVVVNETYRWFQQDAPRVPGADLVGSLHKLIGVGSRTGWVYSPSYFGSAFPEMLGTTPSRVWQRAWGLFLQRGGFEAVTSTIIQPAHQAAQSFSRRLRELAGVAVAFDGPNVLLHVADGIEEETAEAVLRQHGYLISAGRHFLSATPAVRATFLGVTGQQAAAFAETVLDTGIVDPTTLPSRPIAGAGSHQTGDHPDHVGGV